MNTPTDTRARLVATAQQVIDGRVNLLAGVRELLALRAGLQLPDRDDPVFAALQGVGSETDDVGPDFLGADGQPVDADLASYLEAARDSVLAACQGLLKKFA